MKFKIDDKIAIAVLPMPGGGRFGKSGMHGKVTGTHPLKMTVDDVWSGPLTTEYRYDLDLWWEYRPEHVEQDSFPESALEIRN